MRYIVFTNEEGFVQDLAIDPNQDESFYLSKFPSSFIVDEIALPDRDKADLWKIENGAVIIDDVKMLTAKKVELTKLIDEDVARKIAEPITVEGERKKDLVLAMTTLEELKAVDIINI